MKIRVDDDRHRRGDQRDAQVLHDGDDAVVATEFAGDGHQAGGAAGHQRQRPGQRADIAVQPISAPAATLITSVATTTATTIGQCGPSALTASP